MNPRTKNLALAGGAVMVVGFVAVNTLMPAPAPAPPAEVQVVAGDLPGTGSPAAVPSPVAPGEPADVPVEQAPDRRSYAIGLQDLSGLPPDSAAGTLLELWVTWEPPITRGPRLEKLIGDVVLERVIPGSVPEAPVTVLLSVPGERVGDLIYADGYGRLSVVLPH